MNATPEKIGKYEIVQEVGRGSMGTVYSAHDPFSDRLVAIKLAHPQFVDQSEEGQRFRKLFFNGNYSPSSAYSWPESAS